MGNIVYGGIICAIGLFIIYLGWYVPAFGGNLLDPNPNLDMAGDTLLNYGIFMIIGFITFVIGIFVAAGVKVGKNKN